MMLINFNIGLRDSIPLHGRCIFLGGNKALQKLFQFFAQRNNSLNDKLLDISMKMQTLYLQYIRSISDQCWFDPYI